MAYQERGSGPPHFDGKNYQMWSKRMAVFLRGKAQILWDVTVDTGYVQPMNFRAPGLRGMFDANNNAVDYLFCALCQPEFDRVHTEHLACRIWLVLKEWANKDKYHPSDGVLEPRVQMPKAKVSVGTVPAWGERKAVGGAAGRATPVRPVSGTGQTGAGLDR
jgi:hypothetical protein